MKPIIDLMDKSINKLKKLIPPEHEMKCNTCGQSMDLRDLSQVFAHEDCGGIHIDYDSLKQINSSSIKIGTPEQYTKKGTLNLN